MSDREHLLAEALILQGKLAKLAARLRESYEAGLQLDFSALSSIDLIVLESLSARFERSVDVFSKGFLRLLDMIEGAEGGVIMDVLLRAEKRGLIESAEDFYDLRLTRNRIAHEYLDVEALELAAFVLSKTPTILNALEKAANYSLR